MPTPAIDGRLAARVVLLAAIVSLLGAAKLAYLTGTGPYGLDGAFYVNAARNVQEGVGLRTNISMYHYGQVELPTRSPLIYPMWPLAIGYTARAIGLFPAVNYLPPFFYICDLLLIYFLANRIARRFGDAQISGFVTLGHLAALLLGVTQNFWSTTTYPYTEGLGFVFAFGALLALDEGERRRPAMFGVICGVLAGLALLTRNQLVLVGIALLLAAAWSAVCTRRFAFAAAYTATFLALMAFWYLKIEHVGETPHVALPVLNVWVAPANTADYLRQRVEGIVVSLTPTHAYSYFSAFGPAFLLPLISAVVALMSWFRSRPRRFCLRDGAAVTAAAVFTGLGTYAALNLYHHRANFMMPWLFGYRHSLPMILLIVAAAAHLIAAGRALRITAIVCLSVSIALGLVATIEQIATPRPHSPTPAEQQLIAWLDAHPKPPVILTTRAQHLSVYTHASLHWTECLTPASTTRLMLDRLPIDYVIVYLPDRRCSFIGGLSDRLALGQRFGSDNDVIDVLVRRR